MHSPAPAIHQHNIIYVYEIYALNNTTKTLSNPTKCTGHIMFSVIIKLYLVPPP